MDCACCNPTLANELLAHQLKSCKEERQAQFVRDTMGFNGGTPEINKLKTSPGEKAALGLTDSFLPSPSSNTLDMGEPAFFLVGVPGAHSKRYTSESEALEAATSLVNNGNTEAFVLKAVQRVSSSKNTVVDKLS